MAKLSNKNGKKITLAKKKVGTIDSIFVDENAATKTKTQFHITVIDQV